jgi:tRNA1Val (adenine37-N6)-methyltransferase
MPNDYFQFKEFLIRQDQCAMKVTTDGCLFGAWVAEQLHPAIKDGDQLRLLDIGTGTGLLSLMIAQRTNVLIDAIDIDDQAVSQAKNNVENSRWPGRVEVKLMDARKMSESSTYDFIVSNPPFYENDLQSPDDRRRIAHHDSGLGLQELFQVIVKHLSAEGQFFLLLPFKRWKEIETALARWELSMENIVAVRATSRHQPMRFMLRGVKTKVIEPVREEIIIKDGDTYTNRFVELLKYYYLNL